MDSGGLVFIQRRTHKAGAQTCLARLLAHEKIKRYNPVLVASQKGWLTEQCQRMGVPFVEKKFPSSRSLSALLLGNSMFAGYIRRQLDRLGIKPSIVHANDHLEGLLALSLARATGAKSALFLRSSGMSERDYFKYGCDRFDMVAAVCDPMKERANAWDGKKDVALIYDGIYPHEFGPPVKKTAGFPRKLLVLGSADERKGWADLAEALYILSGRMKMPPLELDFTGDKPDPAKNDLSLDRLGDVRVKFLGRVEDFSGLVLGYDLAINPTWHESFGMAAIETLAAGVPLLSSRTGVIEQVIDLPHMLFLPHDPVDLARALGDLIMNWDNLDTDISGCQRSILQKFNINNSIDILVDKYEGLLNG